jgi:hypothetical protein
VTNRRRPTVTMHQRKWIVIAAIFAATAVAVGVVAGTAAVDASPVLSTIRGARSFSTVAAKPTTYATTFPEPNRAAKGNRLSVPIPGNQGGAATGQVTKDWDSPSVQSRAPTKSERKPAEHCDPVGSPLAGPAIFHIPPRRCFAWLGTLPQDTLDERDSRIPVV